jgi:hypothetical protein
MGGNLSTNRSLLFVLLKSWDSTVALVKTENRLSLMLLVLVSSTWWATGGHVSSSVTSYCPTTCRLPKGAGFLIYVTGEECSQCSVDVGCEKEEMNEKNESENCVDAKAALAVFGGG